MSNINTNNKSGVDMLGGNPNWRVVFANYVIMYVISFNYQSFF